MIPYIMSAIAVILIVAYLAGQPEPGYRRAEHPAPWWYRLASRVVPGRCREIPEALHPNRILLRQVAIIRRHVYLQSFASSEDAGWMHSHEFRRAIAIGLWGSYIESTPGDEGVVKAPYVKCMGPGMMHRVSHPSPGHTSLLIGTRRVSSRTYYRTPIGRDWSRHVKRQVERL